MVKARSSTPFTPASHDVAEVLFIGATEDLGFEALDLTQSFQPV